MKYEFVDRVPARKHRGWYDELKTVLVAKPGKWAKMASVAASRSHYIRKRLGPDFTVVTRNGSLHGKQYISDVYVSYTKGQK